MAIPGQRPDLEIRGKVRIGEKRRASSGREYPAAVDYFTSDDSSFKILCGDKPKTIRITPAFDTAEEFFSTGLEWWTQQQGGKNHLACYTKDSGDKPVALRSPNYLDPDSEVVGEERSSGRLPIRCPFRECSHFKKQGNKPAQCRPMGRLTFYLEGETPTQAPLQLDTKSWNSIEAIEKVLARYDERVLLTMRVFDLSVAFQGQGDKRFPVLSIQEVDMEVNTQADVDEADARVALANAQLQGVPAREALAAYLDATRPGWKTDQRYIDRIREIGPEEAIRRIEEQS